MALAQDGGSTVNIPTTSNFHQHFRRRVNTLQEQIDSLALPGASIPDRQATIDAVRIGVARLSSEVADASGDLASYDQRSYSQAIKEIQDKLAVVQASHAPRAKFSFKNKRLATPASEANSATTSRSATPSHLREPDSTGRGVPTPALASPSAHVVGNQNYEHREEDFKLAPFSPDESQWILIDGKRDSYLRWPRGGAEEEEGKPSPQHGKTCIASDITSCVVDVAYDRSNPPPSALTLKTIDTTLVIASDIRGAAHITSLRNSVLVLGCQQFRMHSSHNVDVYLYCRNRPIIEDCSNIRFARIPPALQSSRLGVGVGMEHAGTNANLFDQVDDFKWLRNEASPNWRVMREDESVKEQTWQGILETLQRLDGGGEETDQSLSAEIVARTLRTLDIRAGT